MSYVTLWTPAPTGGAPNEKRPAVAPAGAPVGAALLARLLALAPHVAAEARPGGALVWVDGRGLPARRLARAVRDAARAAGAPAAARVGVAAVPVAAEAAARWGVAEGARPAGGPPAGDPPPCTAVARGAERAFLAAHPVGVLLDAAAAADRAGERAGDSARRRAAAALADAGVVTCGALAALDHAAVEARTGAAGSALWRLARGEDRRAVFRHAARERPSASLDWTEFELRDPAPLVFAANGLVARVCDALARRGEAARALTLTFALAGGGAVVRPVRAARDTADPAAWRRLVRAALERVGAEPVGGPDAPPGLPDGVVGLALAVDAARAADAPQADLFDRGAATAAAAERAAARLVEGEWGAVVRPRRSAHPLPERRLGWEEVAELGAGGRGPGAGRIDGAGLGAGLGADLAPRPAAAGGPDVRRGALRLVRDGAPAEGPPAPVPPAAPADALRLRVLPEPRPLAVTERRGRGRHPAPLRYRERLPEGTQPPRGGLPLVEVLVAAGPDRVVAGHAEGAPVAREYWQCLTDAGALVLLYREPGPEGAGPQEPRPWFLHGWWD